MMRAMVCFCIVLFGSAGHAGANEDFPLVGLHELGAGAAWDMIAVAPVATRDPMDGLRATVNYFEDLADSASTPLLIFLPTHAASIWHDENRDKALRQVQAMKDDLRPRWIVFAKLDNCATSDHAEKAYWREAGWVWSGPSRQFCIPKARAHLTATVTVVDVNSGDPVAESQIEVTGERFGPMMQMRSADEALRCASSPALHAKAKGSALRELGSTLADEVDRLLSTVIFRT